MTKDEIKAKLTDLGIQFDGRLGKTKLQALLEERMEEDEDHGTILSEGMEEDEDISPEGYSEEQIQNIADEVSGKNTPTAEEFLKDKQRVGGEYKTNAGIVIPNEIVAKMRKDNHTYFLDESSKKVAVMKQNPRGTVEFVREYSSAIHGDDFKKLAKGFVAKKNLG